MNLVEPSLDVHACLVAKGNVDDALVGKSAHGGEHGGFLASSQGGCRYEDTAVFPPVGSSLPLVSTCIPERLELGGEISIPSGDAHQKSVILWERLSASKTGRKAI